MAKGTENYRRTLSCSAFRLLTSLLIATGLNPCEIDGKRIISDPYDENGIFSTLSEAVTTSSISPAPSRNADPVIDILTPPETNPLNPYEPYIKGVTGQLGHEDLEFALDYYNPKSLVKELSFDSLNLLKKLADSAMASNTPPNLFMEELQDLISLQNRSRSEVEGSTVRDEVPQIHSRHLSSDMLKRMAEGWKNELKQLEKKYNVSKDCDGPDSITPTRLALMFPHFLNFGQKPFAVTPDIKILSNDKVPGFFKRAEFGGMLPLQWGKTPFDREALLGLHLYAMHGREPADGVPFRTKCVLLRQRMLKSVLSDSRRIRFLVNNEICDPSGAGLYLPLRNAYRHLPSDFIAKIDWNIFGFPNSTVRPINLPIGRLIY